MRDLERWKDKVELSLDGRQIFGLFFGSAVAACLIFVGGVATGKRIGEKAAAALAPSSEDPLAALDQLGAADPGDDGLTFHEALAPADHHAARRAHLDPPRPDPAARPAPAAAPHAPP